MLCDKCSAIDWTEAAQPPGSKHHSSLQQLESSATQGRELCQLILDYAKIHEVDTGYRVYDEKEVGETNIPCERDISDQIFCSLDNNKLLDTRIRDIQDIEDMEENYLGSNRIWFHDSSGKRFSSILNIFTDESRYCIVSTLQKVCLI